MTPSNNLQPTERIGLTDDERFDIYVCGAIFTALRECTKPGWIRTDPEKSEVSQYQDLHAVADAVLRRLKREGLRVAPAEGADSPF